LSLIAKVTQGPAKLSSVKVMASENTLLGFLSYKLGNCYTTSNI